MSPLTQGLNYRSACDTGSQTKVRVEHVLPGGDPPLLDPTVGGDSAPPQNFRFLISKMHIFVDC